MSTKKQWTTREKLTIVLEEGGERRVPDQRIVQCAWDLAGDVLQMAGSTAYGWSQTIWAGRSRSCPWAIRTRKPEAQRDDRRVDHRIKKRLRKRCWHACLENRHAALSGKQRMHQTFHDMTAANCRNRRLIPAFTPSFGRSPAFRIAFPWKPILQRRSNWFMIQKFWFAIRNTYVILLLMTEIWCNVASYWLLIY